VLRVDDIIINKRVLRASVRCGSDPGSAPSRILAGYQDEQPLGKQI
jgi:hypothetical protein